MKDNPNITLEELREELDSKVLDYREKLDAQLNQKLLMTQGKKQVKGMKIQPNHTWMINPDNGVAYQIPNSDVNSMKERGGIIIR